MRRMKRKKNLRLKCVGHSFFDFGFDFEIESFPPNKDNEKPFKPEKLY